MPQTPLVDVRAQYAPLLEEIKDRMAEVLDSGTFILGPNVRAFEEEAAAYLGVPQTSASRTARTRWCSRSTRSRSGRATRSICPAFTFYATAESIARRGATPVFADIDPATLNLDPEDVAARITDRTKALMPVHLFGRPAPLAELAELGLPIIEDAAQAFGANGVAQTGIASTFSFFPTKNLFCLGDGGLIAVRDEELAERIRMLRFHGSRREEGLPLRRLQLAPRRAPGRRAPPVPDSSSTAWNEARREAAARYGELGLGDVCEPPADEPAHVYHMYVVRSPERDRIAAALKQAEIASAAYYVTPLHLQPALRYLGYREGDLPRHRARLPREPRPAAVGRDRRGRAGARRRHRPRGCGRGVSGVS